MIEAGERAPGFELPDQDGTPVKLADLAGRKVVCDGTVRLSKARKAFRGWKAAFRRYGL